MKRQRSYSKLDKIIINFHQTVETVWGKPNATRENPAITIKEYPLNFREKRKSQGFMRINHTGEVCAQALYHGQLTLASTQEVKQMLTQAALEETDHLNWCKDRLEQLHTHSSHLNLFWYIGSYAIGCSAAAFGDPLSLGFVEETEKQVEAHLKKHLKNLSPDDIKSRAILKQMEIDEIHHANTAHKMGAQPLPRLLKMVMKIQSKMMTSLAYWI